MQRMVFRHDIPTEQTPSGEIATRPVSYVVYLQHVRARPGIEYNNVGIEQIAAPNVYRARVDSLPPGLNTSWTMIDEEGQRHDIVSIQAVPRPPRSRMREIKTQRRDD